MPGRERDVVEEKGPDFAMGTPGLHLGSVTY